MSRSVRHATVTALPVELMLIIAHLNPNRGAWWLLASLCKFTNRIMTPLLYAEIRFDHNEILRAVQCCRTLASSPHLACLVRVFDDTRLNDFDNLDAIRQLQTGLAQSLASMSALRCLHYHEISGVGVEVWRTLNKVSATLEFLKIHVDLPARTIMLPNPETSSASANPPVPETRFPRLSKLYFQVHSESTTFAKCFRTITKNSSANIRTLSVYNHTNWQLGPIIFPSDLSWPSLDTLEVPWEVLNDIPASLTRTVQSLNVKGYAYHFNDGERDLALDVFPDLRSLRCHPFLLGRFLPQADGKPHRPIDSVEITYEVDPSDISQLLSIMGHSAIAITTFVVRMVYITPQCLPFSCASALLARLQRMTIATIWFKHANDFEFFTDGLFAHTPRLVSFSLVDMNASPIPPSAPNLELQRKLIRQWEAICPHLEYVDIAGLLHWKKRVGQLPDDWLAVGGI